MTINDTCLFLGWNQGAEDVLEHLKTDNILGKDADIIIVSEYAPDYISKDTTIIQEDFSDFKVLEDIDFAKISLVIIFLEIYGDQATEKADSRNAFTAIQVGEMINTNARIIVEIADDHYTEILHKHISGNIEIIYKEKLDADLIANNIINSGNTVKMWWEIANFDGNRLSTFTLKELGVNGSISLKELRIKLLEEKNPKIIFGYLPAETDTPVLNPSPDTILKQEYFIYILHQPD